MTTAEHSWSRRCSTETIFSIQGKETDIARDTSDTEALDFDTEYEPVTETEEEGPLDGDTTDCSDSDIIRTKVIEVSVREGDIVFADSEHTDSVSRSDSETDFHDYWNCAQCRVANNNPLYRYCQKCYKNRKNFFPPRPRRKHKRELNINLKAAKPEYSALTPTLSQDSGVSSGICSPHSQDLDPDTHPLDSKTIRSKKRRSESADRLTKRAKYSSSSSDTDSDNDTVSRLAKTISDPAITIEDTVITKKVLAHSIKEIERVEAKELCVICITEPKSGVFVHGRIAHICCCYSCAKKVWAKAKRCPVCNCKINNVLKAVVL